VIDLHLFTNPDVRGFKYADVHAGFPRAGSHGSSPLFMQTCWAIPLNTRGLALLPGGFSLMLLIAAGGFMLPAIDARKMDDGRTAGLRSPCFT